MILSGIWFRFRNKETLFRDTRSPHGGFKIYVTAPPHKSISVSDLKPEHKSLSDEMRLPIITENADTGCHLIFMTKFHCDPASDDSGIVTPPARGSDSDTESQSVKTLRHGHSREETIIELSVFIICLHSRVVKTWCHHRLRDFNT